MLVDVGRLEHFTLSVYLLQKCTLKIIKFILPQFLAAMKTKINLKIAENRNNATTEEKRKSRNKIRTKRITSNDYRSLKNIRA